MLMKKISIHLTRAIILFFALVGFLLTAGYVATRTGLTNTEGIIDTQREEFLENKDTTSYSTFPLAHTKEWIAFRVAVTKDRAIIEDVSKKTGIPARLLVAILVPEQMRLFYSNRELFKNIFSPLKILGSQSQFSWGIFGIKDDTARAVEKHLSDKQSPFYPGASYEKMLAFTSDDPDQERFARIIDEHDHYYSYLYTALYVKQIQTQWKKAGVVIDEKPDIIATLWNLGFSKSSPHPNPKSGGAEMEINGASYSFGKLAHDFYYSDELVEIFPVQ